MEDKIHELLNGLGVQLPQTKRKRKTLISDKSELRHKKLDLSKMPTEELKKLLDVSICSKIIMPYEYILIEYSDRISDIVNLPELMHMHRDYTMHWRQTKDVSKYEALAYVAESILEIVMRSPNLIAAESHGIPKWLITCNAGYPVMVSLTNSEYITFPIWYNECLEANISLLTDVLRKVQLPESLANLCY